MLDIIIWAFNNNIKYIILKSILINIILLICVGVLIYWTKSLKNRYDLLMQGNSGGNIETMVVEYAQEVKKVYDKLAMIEKKEQDNENAIKKCLQKIGFIRFNAFEDTGSDLSFAIALLDANDDGVIISSIFGRNESRSYAKSINKSESAYFLSDEEKKALKIAKEKFAK